MPATDFTDIERFLKEYQPFSHLSDRCIRFAAHHLEISYHRRNDTLVLENGMYMVCSGAVQLFDADDQLVDLLAEGGCFASAQLTGFHCGTKAVMAEDSLLYQWQSDVVHQLCTMSKVFRRYYKVPDCGRIRLALATRADDLSLTTRISNVIQREPVCISSDKTIRQAAQLMNEQRVSCLLITHMGNLCGMLTDRDLRCKVVAQGLDITQPVATIMTSNPVSIELDTCLFESVLTMSRYNIHHLPVVNDGQVAGLLTTTDLIKLNRSQPVFIIGEIWKADSISAVAAVCQVIPQLFIRLVDADARAQDISRILTAISDAVNQRLIELAHEQLGPAPVDYAWLAFGSQAREDQNISSDQDNALLLSNDFDHEQHRAYFDQFTALVCDGLHQCGYMYCPGNIMASNHKWRMNIGQWGTTFTNWVNKATPAAVLNSSIFFDMRCIAGNQSLYQELEDTIRRIPKHSVFLGHLAGNAIANRPPLGFFRNFVVESSGDHKNELDLKKHGSMPITDIARLYALANGLVEVNTIERLQQLGNSNRINRKDSRNLADAYELINSIRLQYQANELRQHLTPDNFIAPDRLSNLQRSHLKDSFSVIKANQDSLALAYPAIN